MASSVDQVRSKATTWEAVKRRRLTLDDENEDRAPQQVPQHAERNGITKPNAVHEDVRPRIQASAITDLRGDAPAGPGPYTQRQLGASTPGPSQNPLLSLSHPHYGLPARLVQNLASMGIRSMYPWQCSCLLAKGNLSGKRNLVYTAPTGGGKSLVADVCMLKRVLEGKKAILVLPYVALIQEKQRWLRRAVDGVRRESDGSERWLPPFLDHCSIRVGAFYGGSKTQNSWLDIDIAVCTIEKANMLINAAILENTTQDLGIVVIDELHMLDDDYRGYLVEVLAAKLLSLEMDLQIIGMSATLANTELLARWLKAKYYESRYKPIPIEEHLVCDNTIYDLPGDGENAAVLSATQGLSASRVISSSSDPAIKNPVLNSVTALVMETVDKGYGVLVFCNSRSACESTAMLIARTMPSLKSLGSDLLSKRGNVINSLRSLALLPLDDTLAETVLYGVGFHHAGLTSEERQLLNDAFDSGVLRVIVATCSLAAGVNLPARRVILQGARMGRDMVGPAMLRQMRGRAGRKGKDEVGETYVCCKGEDLEEIKALLATELAPIQSSLTSERRGIKRAVLESIVVRLATHELAVREFVGNTLLAQMVDEPRLAEMITATIQELREANLIQVDARCYEATALGRATVMSGLSPEDSEFVHAELQRAMTSFVMDGEMHVFYIFTPVSASSGDVDDIDWAVFRQEIADLDESSLRVMLLCGVNPGFVNAQANAQAAWSVRSAADLARARIHRRFYTALQLRDLCNEQPLHAVARKYRVARGAVQTLLQACQGFAGATIRFCRELRWGMLAAVLEHMSDRLQASARADLLELAQIPFVKSRTARALWDSGLRGVRAVAEADADTLAQVLLLAQPSRRKTLGGNEEGYLRKLQERAAVIVDAAGRLLDRRQREVVEVEADL